MYEIISKRDLVPKIHLLKITEPTLAKKSQPGQFVLLRIDEEGERIPLNIADWDESEGSVTVVFFEKGTTTHKLVLLKEGDHITNFVGPLGVPKNIGISFLALLQIPHNFPQFPPLNMLR
jgi:ferredoxin--NADP+ reductase